MKLRKVQDTVPKCVINIYYTLKMLLYKTLVLQRKRHDKSKTYSLEIFQCHKKCLATNEEQQYFRSGRHTKLQARKKYRGEDLPYIYLSIQSFIT